MRVTNPVEICGFRTKSLSSKSPAPSYDVYVWGHVLVREHILSELASAPDLRARPLYRCVYVCVSKWGGCVCVWERACMCKIPILCREWASERASERASVRVCHIVCAYLTSMETREHTSHSLSCHCKYVGSRAALGSISLWMNVYGTACPARHLLFWDEGVHPVANPELNPKLIGSKYSLLS